MKDTTDLHTEVDWVLKDCTQSLDVGEWTAGHAACVLSLAFHTCT